MICRRPAYRRRLRRQDTFKAADVASLNCRDGTLVKAFRTIDGDTGKRVNIIPSRNGHGH
jgi:hypothetical protein